MRMGALDVLSLMESVMLKLPVIGLFVVCKRALPAARYYKVFR